MAIRNIIKEGDEILRKKCRPVEVFDKRLWTLLDDMAETMYAADGVGLAASQVGVLKQVIVIDIGEGLIELINPVVISEEGKQTDLEGCLSFPKQYGMVTRPLKVKVKAFDRNGKKFFVEGSELLARALCHEIDHLKGIVFKDLTEEILEEEDE
ncbi:MAG: def [Oscillospiraceae bacterium]|nr:def [Oscillospiraceae bacterium]